MGGGGVTFFSQRLVCQKHHNGREEQILLRHSVRISLSHTSRTLNTVPDFEGLILKDFHALRDCMNPVK